MRTGFCTSSPVLLTMAITEYVACASIPATNMAGLGCRRTLRIQRNTPHE